MNNQLKEASNKAFTRQWLKTLLPELSLVVVYTFRVAVLGRTLQHHNVNCPGGVSPARPDPTFPVPSETRMDV